MPKLLQIDSCLNMCSTGRITESIGALAISQGWDVYIVHGARYSNPPSCMHSIQAVSKFGEYMHYAEGLVFDNHGLASRSSTRKVIKLIKDIKPDVIQLHCIHGYYLNYKLLFEYLNTIDVPVVWTFHDCWAFTGHCAHFMSAACYKWRDEGCHLCPLKYDYPRSLFDNSAKNYNLKRRLFIQNKHLHIVTVSKWLEKITRESFFRNNSIQTIYNGVDLDIFKPVDSSNLRKKLNLQGKYVLVAAATAWSENKGLNDYIKLADLIPNDVTLVLVGLTDGQIKQLPATIIGKRRTDSAQELAQYYSMADIVLNLSYQETFGLTTAEAMACGTPGIVYNTTASPELITNETGSIVELGNIEEISKTIKDIISKGKAFYSNQCRNRAVMLFDKDNRFMDYIHLYESLIKH